jgi:hypothetical protein
MVVGITGRGIEVSLLTSAATEIKADGLGWFRAFVD